MADLTPFPDAITFGNGVSFLGYGADQSVSGGEALEVWLAWWVRSPPPPETRYHFFVHLLDQGGGLRSQHDGSGFPTGSWHTGDLVLSRFSVPIPADLPAGTHLLWAGLYRHPEVVNVPVLDVAGNPVSDGVMVGEIEVH